MERLLTRVHTIHGSTGKKVYRVLRGSVKKELDWLTI
jgi:hypothetical protein